MKQVSPDQRIDAIQPARIEWRDGDPFSIEFNDVYFSRAGGLAETEYVFLQHNRLAERFQSGDQPFVIAETGFGTGLNFLCAWNCFLQNAPTSRVLHFISAEKYPLSKPDLLRAHARWPKLSALSGQLAEQYPALTPGFHRLTLDAGRVRLTLLFGDAASQFAQLNGKVDAWFLDGFSPAQNPELWQMGVLQQMQRLGKPRETSFATFTAASWVRKALQEHGFEVEKDAGFGRKRDMLFGRLHEAYQAPVPEGLEAITKAEPWFEFHAPPKPSGAIVIGAGLAGAATAAALAARGIAVTVLDQALPASGASGNAQGVIFTKLSPYNTPQTRFYQQCYLFACRHVAQTLGPPDAQNWQRCGMLQLGFDAAEQQRQQEVIQSGLWPADLAQPVSAEEASELAGVRLPSGGLFFPDSGWVHPPALIARYLDHPNISLKSQLRVSAIQQAGNRWTLVTDQGETLKTDCLIVANSFAATEFEPLTFLPLSVIRGQVTQVSSTKQSQNLKTLLLYAGYATPARHQDGAGTSHCIGASFVPKCTDVAIRASENLENLALLYDYLQQPVFSENDILAARAAVRSQPTDYLPALGPVPDEAFFLDAYARLRTGNFRHPFPPGVYRPGLYLNVGHGSRGIATTTLAAEFLASLICHEPLPVDQQLANFLNPARFLIRGLKRRNR